MWYENVPKIELHCHLDGSVPVSVLKKLCAKENVDAPKGDAEFRKLIEAKEDCESLTEYLKAFEVPLRVLRTEDVFFEASYETVIAAAKEGVRYLELRFAPLLSEQRDLCAEQIIEASVAGLKKAEKEYNITADFILCGMRHFREKENMRTLDLAKRYLRKGVCGVDLAGDESAYPNENFEGYLKKAALLDIPLTVHSGECRRKRNIELAVEYGTKRIGHGIAMHGDERLQEKLVRHHIGVELCPSSNLQTKAISEWGSYPFREFFGSGIKVSVNTDNRTVTNTTMTKELRLLNEYFHLTSQEAGRLMRQSLDVSFAEESTKKLIKKEIEDWENKITV